MTVSDQLLARAQRAVAAGQEVCVSHAEADELGDLLAGMAYRLDDDCAAEQAAAVEAPVIPTAPLPDA